jgi:phage tail sheath protein FI
MLTAPPKTPGVYINELDAFPNSVVEVATAVPAFIGYTEKAVAKGKSLLSVPTRITSITEYENYFGKAPKMKFTISAAGAADSDFIVNGKGYALAADKKFNLYNSMRLFFQNGGGACYIVSVGDYSGSIDSGKLTGGIAPLLKEQEPTMIVIPEAVQLDSFNDCNSLQQAMLAHCAKMQSRVAILDIYQGYEDLSAPSPVDSFRNALGINALNYGAAYYPWVNTTVVQASEVDFTWFDNSGGAGASSSSSSASSTSSSSSGGPAGGAVTLVSILNDDAGQTYKDNAKKITDAQAQIAFIPTTAAGTGTSSSSSSTSSSSQSSASSASSGGAPSAPMPNVTTLDQTLLVISPAYKMIMDALRTKLSLLPPSPAMAGVYTLVDNTRGVWKAPANVSLSSVISPAVNISSDEQEDLNVPLQGKAVNAIRPFIGEGVLVWGARTLDGNSQDWRYINVRRTMIMLEQSIKIATKAYVFEPNDANTWVSVKSMINNFLTSQWKAGALVGAKAEDAYDVQVGLGATMTADDILSGYMNITIKLAISHPAEFIILTFQQQQQKS